MDRGTYSAAAGGILQLRRLDIVSNNLANLNSSGFKQQMLVAQTQRFEDTLASQLGEEDLFGRPDQARTPGVLHVDTATDFAPGSIKSTGNQLDVALIQPNHFFVINTSEGQQLTRAGNFTLDTEGTLVTQDGFEVKGTGGPLTATGPGATISEGGTLMAGGQPVGVLDVVEVLDLSVLQRVGMNRFKMPEGAAAPQSVEPQLIGQSLEMSNISAVSGMIELITANRAFDLYTKAATTIDGMNQIAITQVGRRSA